MNIKDPAVHELARELAGRRKSTLTEAVRQALQEVLERERQNREDYVDRVMAVAREARYAMDRAGLVLLTDDEMYDADGLPR